MSAVITRLAARGDGATDDGRHVALAAPGDTIADDGTILPGPHHQIPPCRHFPKCGGCQLQHIDDETFSAFLVDRVAGALRSQGLALPEIRTPHLSPPRTRRRASLRAERIGHRIVLGFNEEASHRIVDMMECHVLAPDLFALIAPLRALLGTMLDRKKGAEVRLTRADQGIDLLLTGVTADGLAASEAITEFAQTHKIARLALDDGFGPQSRWEPDAATVTLGGVAVPLPINGFLQATPDGEAALVEGVMDIVGGAGTVADLFAGLGTFALPLSAQAKVLAAEGARDPVLALKLAAARAGRQIVADHRDLFRRPYMAKELSRFDAVVLDPPRAGAKEQMGELAQADLSRIAYVSCNPATFARDAAMLAASGWRIDWIRPIGQFRWSTHVELVASLSR
ncbi:class I SAM-dependent RNA methyltransferase [Sphingomonas sp. BIUV-7]|uniref:Class I SAM-dependent RNA methyltransferase n=1 Tax=Sphingomonas natans TaxID=3063330 RepID=A0ABT8YBM8_9SPHN|nr:class I SAM-dependent RNA methyltransferase [Sphingomonas sp. BIUV-7]MDO6415124.1 class I SAM-dependent RNA methyltransferase [Sphingomonas sp. BIUV-7]